jgi:outer membrane protein assembly factor BamB
MLATLAGVRQIVLFDGEQVAGYATVDGKLLWAQKWTTMNGINVAQPLILPGDRVFISSSYQVGCTLLQVALTADKWSVERLWPKENLNMRCKFTSPVAYNGYIYGLDDGILACLDPETGTRKWRDGRFGHGQLLLTEDLLLILSETGKLALVQATPEGFHQLGVIPVFSDRTWNYLALADGMAFLRNEREMACYDLTNRPAQ